MEETEQAKEQAEEAAKASVDTPGEVFQDFASGEDLAKIAEDRLASLKATYSHQLGYDCLIDKDPSEATETIL